MDSASKHNPIFIPRATIFNAPVRVNLDADAWVDVWQLPPEKVPSKLFSRLWDARPRTATHLFSVNHNFRRRYETQRLTRSFGVLPPFTRSTGSYMFAECDAELETAMAAPAATLHCPMPSEIQQLSHVLAGEDHEAGNQATVNWYSCGNDWLPFHSDLSDGGTSDILSVTLAPRDAPPRNFVIKHKSKRNKPDAAVVIETCNGTVIVMGGSMQSRYVHGLPPADDYCEPRINVSFRTYTTVKSNVLNDSVMDAPAE
jgi:hypothetical protein